MHRRVKLLQNLVITFLLLTNTVYTVEENTGENDNRKINHNQTNTDENTSLKNEKNDIVNEHIEGITTKVEVNMNPENGMENMTEANTTEEVCLVDKEYCDYTKEEFVAMMEDYIYPQPYEWVLIAIYLVVFIAGLLGNALVCIAVYRNRSMRTVTNYFIVNLAVGDFMVILFCLPPTLLWDVTETWFFGAAMCKIILFFQSVSVTVSVLTLTFISIDRWYAICFPLKFKSTTGRAKLAILVIWAISLIFNAPELVVLTTVKVVPMRFDLEYLIQCMPTWSEDADLVWHIVKLVIIYTIPLLLMSVAYYNIVKVLWRSNKIPGQADTDKLAPAEKCQLRSRRKAAKMLAAVVIMFAVCYFPVHLLALIKCTSVAQSEVVTFLGLISHVLCYFNSAVNPVIYNFMNGKFRKEFRRAFCCSVKPMYENSTSLSPLTSSKCRPCELSLDKRSSHNYGRKTTMF